MSFQESLKQDPTRALVDGTSHFWVSSYPYFDSTLVSLNCSEDLCLGDLGSYQAEQQDSTEQPIRITFFDADGKVFNEIAVGYRPGEVGLLELEPLVSACKLESGMKHAHLKVCGPAGFRHQVRIHTRETCAFIRELSVASKYSVPCFPILFSEERSNFISVVSLSEAAAKVKCRIFIGNRAPEAIIDIPPNGARIIHLESQFEEVLRSSRAIQAYARLVSLNDAPAGVQHVEHTETGSGGSAFYSVT